jgi:hypothetical protein
MANILDALAVSDAGTEQDERFRTAKQIADAGKNIWGNMNLLERAALATAPIPILGDVTGLASDAYMYATKPEERNLLNYGLSLSGLLPFVPAPSALRANKNLLEDPMQPITSPEQVKQIPGGTGRVLQTQKAGTVIDSPAGVTRTDKGYIANPVLDTLSGGNVPEGVTPAQATKLRNMQRDFPLFAEMAGRRGAGNQVVITEDLYAPELSLLEQAGKNRPLVVLPADKTMAGAEATRIGGVDIDPFDLQGGPHHADKWGSWRSEPDAAKAKQAHIQRVAEETGQDPLVIFMAMGDPGSNFSTMASEGVLSYIKAVGGLPKEARTALDKAMRSLPDTKDTANIAKTWPGYENPEQMLAWLTDINQPFKKGEDASLGNRRKAFMQVLSNVDMQKYGLPDVSDVYATINQPDLRGMPVGASGYRGGIGDPNVDPLNLPVDYTESGHRSYSTVIPLQGTFAIKEPPVPHNILFNDPIQSRIEMGKTPAQAYRSLQTSGGKQDYQLTTEEWGQRLFDYLEQQGRGQ